MKLWELGLQTFYNLGRAVGRVVLYHEHIKLRFQFKNITENVFDILFFVIGRYDDNSVVHGLLFYKYSVILSSLFPLEPFIRIKAWRISFALRYSISVSVSGK